MSEGIEKAVTVELENNTPLKALINKRVYWNKLPQEVTLPALTLQVIDGKAIQAHSEPSCLPTIRLQITAWGTTLDTVVSVSKSAKNAIDGHRGTWGSGGYVTSVESVRYSGKRDFTDPDTGLTYRTQDFQIMYKE
jgi:hypothetical protein